METQPNLLTQETVRKEATPFEVVRTLPGITRAWPGKNGRLTFEMRAQTASETPTVQLRAGQISRNGEVTLLPAGTDIKLTALETELAANPQASLAVHRWGKRAVLIDENTVTKITRPGKTPLPPNLPSLPTAAITAANPAAGITKFVKLPGRTLHDLAEGAGPGWMQFIKQLEILPTLTTGLNETKPFTAADEQQHLETWLKHVENYGTLTHLENVHALRQTVQKVQTLLTNQPQKLVATHRDLHDKQVLWDGKTAYLLDLDTFCLAPAGLDLGNLTAHLELREIQRKISPEFKNFLIGQLSQLPDYELHPIYKAASQLRLACVYSFRPGAATWLPTWIETSLETVAKL
ncbi:MAG: phosphotransferase [Actinomycetaceae bacterium]|nr:phosphotransferase [Actinomycetaceae bacterium]